jgi:AraC-like DNA-binding protein
LENAKKIKPQSANPELKKMASNHLAGFDFQNEALIELSKNYIELKKFDSAVYFAQKAVSQTEKSRLGNYFETKSYLVLGDAYFSAKKNNLAQNAYFRALEKCNSFDNPFLKKEIHHKISTTFLADKNIEKFNFHNQQALNFENLADENENNAANTAYQLLSAEQDEKLTSEKNKYRTVFIALLGLFSILILLKILLFFRNRNSLKTYETLNNYLNKKPATEERKPIAEQESKGSGLLKESEEQILAGLKKFESSTKFTNKEMSLGMLAAQLNTNTKYLSEVINRHKQKNFNAYINELRINHITEKIKNDSNYLNYKVSYLADEAGFSSHSTFTTVFKSIVGISPIGFVELIKNQKETVL